MKAEPNGTHAKEVAIHFLQNANLPLDRPSVSRTIVQAKRLLSDGYTKDDIIRVTDHIIKQGTNVYSFGYISRCIGDTLATLRAADSAKQREREAESIKQEIALVISEQRSGVKTEDESTKRNREKARRTDVQSRFGKKFDFDMFEEQ